MTRDMIDTEALHVYDDAFFSPATVDDTPNPSKIKLYVVDPDEEEAETFEAMKDAAVIRWKGKLAFVSRGEKKIRCGKQMDVAGVEFEEEGGNADWLYPDEMYKQDNEENTRLTESILFDQDEYTAKKED